MNPILEKERELSLYLEEWVNARFREWNDIYSYIYRDRCTGIYLLKSGDQLLQLLEDIIGNIGEHLIIEENQHLIPSKFSSIEQLLNFLGNFQKHIKNRYYLIENNLRGNETDMIVIDMYQMCSDIDQMVTRCQNIYQRNDTIPVPYLQAKNALSDNNVQLFVTLLKSLIKNVPYNIHKEKLDEGYFHTIIHVITSVLGMNPISEAETSDGRIDMMIEYPNQVFIMEFKYSPNNKDRSSEALNQIKEKKYAEAYFIKGKPIEGVGMSFSQVSRNIEYYVQDSLFTPNVSNYGQLSR